MIQSSATQNFRRYSYQPDSNSKNSYPHKKSRLNGAKQTSSIETGPIILISKGKEAQGIKFNQDAAAASTDFRRTTLATESLRHHPENEPSPQETFSRGSNTHLPPPVNCVTMQEGGSPSKWGTNQVTVPSKSDQDKFIDEPGHLVGSGRPIHTWILQSSHPIKAWVLWPGANLIRADLQFVFAKFVEITGLTEIRLIEIMFETPEKSFTFPTSREDRDQFEDMKQFMAHLIEKTCREQPDSKILLSIWMSPKEIK